MAELKTVRVQAGNMGNNNYILYAEGRTDCILVDASGDGQALRQALEQLGLTPALLLLTHGHFDHILAVTILRETFKIPVAIHEADALYLRDPAYNLSEKTFGHPFVAEKAEQTLQDGEIVQAAGLELTVLHTPGHSPGSVCFVCEQTLITGDTLFHRGMGRVDLPGSQPQHMMASLQRLFALPGDYDVLPGHNSLTTLDAERAIHGVTKGSDAPSPAGK